MKILMFILLMILCVSVKSQTGLGDFKLNKTKIDFIISKYPDFVEMTDSTDSFLVRRFESTNYKILNIEVKNINLIFYEDYLVSFSCDRDVLIDNYLTSKYGKPQVRETIQVVKIDNVVYNEEKVLSEWKNRDIIMVSSYTKQFNDYFKVMVNNHFNIYLKK